VVANQTEYLGLWIAAASAIKAVKVTAKEAVLVGFHELFCPELVDVKDILDWKLSMLHRKSRYGSVPLTG
jgi:hypothetical protein